MDPFALEEQQWAALTDTLATVGMMTVFGMILTPVPQFLFCGLTQKEKEARMASFSFSFLLLSLLNNLLWLAYSQKVGDQNIGIPAMVGTLVAVFLVVVYQSVKASRNQIIACFILVSISEIFFSSLVPAFLAGCTASFLSISTYMSTLGQIPYVIKEKDPRFINMPIVTVSIINATVWTAYAVLKKDIPLFMTNFFAFAAMSVNLIFYLWSIDVISSSSIQLMISFFQIAFPESDEIEDFVERDLDEEDGQCLTKEQAQARYLKQQQRESAATQETRPTEDTRLTSQSNTSLTSRQNPFYYTGSFDDQEERKSLGYMDTVVNQTYATINDAKYVGGAAAMNTSTNLSDHFMLDDSAIEFILKEDEQSVLLSGRSSAGSRSKAEKQGTFSSAASNITEPKHDEDLEQLDAQSGSETGRDTVKSTNQQSEFDFQIEEQSPVNELGVETVGQITQEP